MAITKGTDKNDNGRSVSEICFKKAKGEINPTASNEDLVILDSDIQHSTRKNQTDSSIPV
jgi:hypothetical protein